MELLEWMGVAIAMIVGGGAVYAFAGKDFGNRGKDREDGDGPSGRRG